MKPNRLSKEKSPYLLQHQHNPVDWFPWSSEAFAKARNEAKPLFLSIGYSTCHWCHVMERESFEDEEVAKYLNEHFVSIKLDREERPDIDRVYMTFVQATSGQGGWPLNVFLTPDLKPFYGGTYFPPTNVANRPGFLSVLKQIQNAWESRRQDIDRSANEVCAHIEEALKTEHRTTAPLQSALLAPAIDRLKGDFDPVHGGFGGAPKFPRPTQPALLLRYGVRKNDPDAVHAVLRTCEAMAGGGIQDQLGGGFARYSVDAEWLVPHFEKMLYDNAQLAQLYLDAYLASGDSIHRDTATSILEYVLRDMTDSGGGFYSAEDADSEGKEGKFYCWTLDEVTRLLDEKSAAVAIRYFGITKEGNFVDHSDPHPLPGQNVLHVAGPELSSAESALLPKIKQVLLEAREKRIRPQRDDKILTAWNGLMLGALARASIVLQQPKYLRAARANAGFVRKNLWDASKKALFHRWREGDRQDTQILESYSFYLAGMLDLYQATLAQEDLQFSVELADSLIERFYDREQGGFWQTPLDTAHVLFRCKEAYDGAEPAGNSVAVLSLLRLHVITGRPEYREAAGKTLELFSDRLQRLPHAVPHLLQGLMMYVDEPLRVVIVPGLEGGDCGSLLQVAHAHLGHEVVVMGNQGPVEATAPGLKPAAAQPAAYVCTGTSCLPPVHDAESLKRLLAGGLGS